jgi:hypothetical protein
MSNNAMKNAMSGMMNRQSLQGPLGSSPAYGQFMGGMAGGVVRSGAQTGCTHFLAPVRSCMSIHVRDPTTADSEFVWQLRAAVSSLHSAQQPGVGLFFHESAGKIKVQRILKIPLFNF